MDEELRQQILRMVEENERELQRSREEEEFLDKLLQASERRTEHALRKLRQAGVLKSPAQISGRLGWKTSVHPRCCHL